MRACVLVPYDLDEAALVAELEGHPLAHPTAKVDLLSMSDLSPDALALLEQSAKELPTAAELLELSHTATSGQSVDRSNPTFNKLQGNVPKGVDFWTITSSRGVYSRPGKQVIGNIPAEAELVIESYKYVEVKDKDGKVMDQTQWGYGFITKPEGFGGWAGENACGWFPLQRLSPRVTQDGSKKSNVENHPTKCPPTHMARKSLARENILKKGSYIKDGQLAKAVTKKQCFAYLNYDPASQTPVGVGPAVPAGVYSGDHSIGVVPSGVTQTTKVDGFGVRFITKDGKFAMIKYPGLDRANAGTTSFFVEADCVEFDSDIIKSTNEALDKKAAEEKKNKKAAEAKKNKKATANKDDKKKKGSKPSKKADQPKKGDKPSKKDSKPTTPKPADKKNQGKGKGKGMKKNHPTKTTPKSPKVKSDRPNKSDKKPSPGPSTPVAPPAAAAAAALIEMNSEGETETDAAADMEHSSAADVDFESQLDAEADAQIQASHVLEGDQQLDAGSEVDVASEVDSYADADVDAPEPGMEFMVEQEPQSFMEMGAGAASTASLNNPTERGNYPGWSAMIESSSTSFMRDMVDPKTIAAGQPVSKEAKKSDSTPKLRAFRAARPTYKLNVPEEGPNVKHIHLGEKDSAKTLRNSGVGIKKIHVHVYGRPNPEVDKERRLQRMVTRLATNQQESYKKINAILGQLKSCAKSNKKACLQKLTEEMADLKAEHLEPK